MRLYRAPFQRDQLLSRFVCADAMRTCMSIRLNAQPMLILNLPFYRWPAQVIKHDRFPLSRQIHHEKTCRPSPPIFSTLVGGTINCRHHGGSRPQPTGECFLLLLRLFLFFFFTLTTIYTYIPVYICGSMYIHAYTYTYIHVYTYLYRCLQYLMAIGQKERQFFTEAQ